MNKSNIEINNNKTKQKKSNMFSKATLQQQQQQQNYHENNGMANEMKRQTQTRNAIQTPLFSHFSSPRRDMERKGRRVLGEGLRGGKRWRG